jgi:predicted RNA-binding protein with RPS1 domain
LEEARKKPHERLKPGDVVDGVVDRIEPYGFFLQLKGGGRGMVHVSEIGSAPEGTDSQKPVAEQFPKGTKIKVAVLEIDPEHRIRLSRAAVPELEKGTAPETYLKHKSQHELEEKLLRSASKPPKPAAAPRRARPDGRPGARPRATPATVEAQPDAPDRQPRRERPPKQRPVSVGKSDKSGGLGTLGDLLKVKLQQRKN